MAASRTVRAPSRLDADTFVPGQPPYLLTGGPDVVSETARVFELGYRGQPHERLTFSVAGYRAFYDHLRTTEVAASRTSIFFGNGMKGTTTGLEAWGTYQALPEWRLSSGVTLLHEDLELRPGSNDVGSPIAQLGRDPKRSLRLRSSVDLPRQSEFDVTARYVSARMNPTVPSYTAIDVRLGWKARPNVDLSVTGQNLFGSGHGELTDIATRSELGRTVFVSLVTRFGRGS
jgi:iron complex outermembrane receptor protein